MSGGNRGCTPLHHSAKMGRCCSCWETDNYSLCQTSSAVEDKALVYHPLEGRCSDGTQLRTAQILKAGCGVLGSQGWPCGGSVPGLCGQYSSPRTLAAVFILQAWPFQDILTGNMAEKSDCSGVVKSTHLLHNENWMLEALAHFPVEVSSH